MNPLASGTIGSLIQNPTLQLVTQADAILDEASYEFVGYHGTNCRGAISIAREGFDPRFAGSSAGLARGMGLYVARRFNLAHDFAEVATHAGEPGPPDFVQPFRQGLAGDQAVLRVYARNFSAMQEGVDYVWGRMGGTSLREGEYWDRLNLWEQEIVFRTRVYPALVAIPTTEQIEAELVGEDLISSPSLQMHESPW